MSKYVPDIWRQEDPDDETVWEVCKQLRECHRCPSIVETDYGPCKNMCRLTAEETIKTVCAMQKREFCVLER